MIYIPRLHSKCGQQITPTNNSVFQNESIYLTAPAIKPDHIEWQVETVNLKACNINKIQPGTLTTTNASDETVVERMSLTVMLLVVK